jgi:hypothetical protein
MIHKFSPDDLSISIGVEPVTINEMDMFQDGGFTPRVNINFRVTDGLKERLQKAVGEYMETNRVIRINDAIEEDLKRIVKACLAEE